jgi:uncharacterized repeat protein (TIGR03803 family)
VHKTNCLSAGLPTTFLAMALTMAAAAGLFAQPTRPTLTILNSFTGSDGSSPYAGVVIGPRGVLYGTTNGGNGIDGTVYSLTPPASAGGAWTENVLYAFAPGSAPYAGVVMDGAGVLYGTTQVGPIVGIGCTGACGAVFSLTPPASTGGAWTESTLYTFVGGTDGVNPNGLAIGNGGLLYGTTSLGGSNICDGGCGTVFSLTPPTSPGGAWTENVIHTFVGIDGLEPLSGVAIDNAPGGTVLYGTTDVGGPTNNNDGTAYSLKAPATAGGAWTETVLYTFIEGQFPIAGVTMGGRVSGRPILYGTTKFGGAANHGYVYSLTPPASPGGAWTLVDIFDFTGTVHHGGGDGAYPVAGVVIGDHGVLYGTTTAGGRGVANDGTVYALTPPAGGAVTWTEQVVHSFAGASGGEGAAPYGGIAIGSGAGGQIVLYGTTQAGGTSNLGTVFSLTL